MRIYQHAMKLVLKFVNLTLYIADLSNILTCRNLVHDTSANN